MVEFELAFVDAAVNCAYRRHALEAFPGPPCSYDPCWVFSVVNHHHPVSIDTLKSPPSFQHIWLKNQYVGPWEKMNSDKISILWGGVKKLWSAETVRLDHRKPCNTNRGTVCVAEALQTSETVGPDQKTETGALGMYKYKYICVCTRAEQCLFKTATLHRQTSVLASAVGANPSSNQTLFFSVQFQRCLRSPTRRLCSAWLN